MSEGELVGPGVWWIDGYVCRRRHLGETIVIAGEKVKLERRNRYWVIVNADDIVIAVARTLDEARELISEWSYP